MSLGGLLVSMLACGTGCASMQPTLEGVSARVVDIDFERVELAIDVKVRNNAFMGINTPGGRYSLDIAKKPFLKSDTVPPGEFPAGGVGVITLPAEIRYADLLQFYEAVRNSAEMDFHVEGALAFEVAGQPMELPFAHDGKFPVLRVPKIKLTKVEKQGFSLSGAEIAAEGSITNPNVFALGVSDLGYRLKLGEIEVGRVDVTTDEMIEAGASGILALTCKLSTSAAAQGLMGGSKLGSAELRANGAVVTPWGSVELPRFE